MNFSRYKNTLNLRDDVAAWRQREKEIVAYFQVDAIDNLGLADAPSEAVSLAWRKAWEDGHAEGLESVYYHFEELADIIKAAMN